MRSPLLIFACIAALLLAGRSHAQVRADAADSRSSRKHGGTYRLNLPASPRTLDPVRMTDRHSALIANQIYDLLLDYDSTMTLRPRLAKAWEVSADGLTYTYHLRTGIRFQDDRCFPGGKGRTLTARDVKYCFDRLLDDRADAYGGAAYFIDNVRGAREYRDATARALPNRTLSIDGAGGFRAVNDSTFAIELLEPFAPFKHYPSLSFCYIYPHEAVTHYGEEFFRNPVGTGPFRLKEWKNEQSMVLARNANYWRDDLEGKQLPYLDNMVVTFGTDEKEMLRDFEKGSLNELYLLSNEATRSLLSSIEKRNDGETAIITIAPLSTQFYGMLTIRLPFTDRRVRQAFNHAVDRVKLVRYVLGGHGVPALHGITPPGIPGYPIDSIRGYDYDPEKGRALLAEAGYPGGKNFPSIELLINDGGGRNAEVAQAVQEMIGEALGVRVKIRPVAWAQLIDLAETGRAQFFRSGWIAEYPDPESHLSLLYGGSSNSSERSSINTARYANHAFDSLYHRAIGTIDDAERFRLYREAERIAIADAPVLILFHDIHYLFLKRSVRGIRTNATQHFDYSEVWLAE